MMAPAQAKSSPSLLRRLVAMLYDSLLVVALVFAVNALALGIASRVTGQQVLSPLVVQILTACSIVGFFCLFWIRDGQTLGMQAWRIRLVDFQGRTPGLPRALLRCLGACLSAACLGLGYLWCVVDRNHRYWHDYLSGTELILLPKREKARRR